MIERDRAPWRRVAAAALVAAWPGMDVAPAGPAQQPAPAPALEIVHDPLPCLTTSTAPRVEASISPPDRAASARVYWRVLPGPPGFYYTAMSGTPPRFQALLPRVTAAAQSIEYYIEASDRAGATRRTPSFVAPLVAQGCIARGIVPLVAGLGLTIGLTDPGEARVPAGINADDVANVILPSGETVAVTGNRGSRRGGAAAVAPRSGGIPKGVLIGAGALAVGGIAAAAGGGGGGGGGGSTPAATPTSAPAPSPTPTPTPPPTFRFAEAEATWSGPGDVDVLLLDSSGATVTGVQTVPAGCESTASRTERVVLQGTAARAGGYQVRLAAKSCGTGTPSGISVLLTVQTESGPKCPSTFIVVPVGQTVAGCTFNLP
jgi:hypothetical protein